MKVAFIVYDNVTLLDFAGMYDPVTRLKSMGFMPDLAYETCAPSGRVRSSEGVVLLPDRVNNDLSEYDYVFVPGGDGIRELMGDRAFLNWISAASAGSTIAAVCGGSLLLGAAGLLRQKRATTHPGLAGFLENFAGTVVTDRIVDEGTVITAGGVTSAVDLGLYVCEKIAGRTARQKIAQQMDYHSYPVL